MKGGLKKMNKKGQAVAIWIIAVVVILAGGFFLVSQTALGGSDAIPTSEDCEIDTTLRLNVVDAINKGTAVTAGGVVKVNGGINKAYVSGTTTFSPGDEVELLVNASNFVSTIANTGPLKCGVNELDVELYATDDAAFTIFNSEGDAVTNNIVGGAINQTTSSSTINMEVRVEGVSDQSSGDLVIIIEATNTSEVDDMILSGEGATKVSVPEFYTINGAASIVRAYEVPAVVDGVARSYTLAVSPESGETIGLAPVTAVYVTAYSKQAYVDVDGTYKVGIENADGTSQAEDDWDYDFAFGA